MADTILQTDFSEGDILTAGIIGSISSVNGITQQINTNTLSNIPTKLKFVGADLVEGVIDNSTNETEIANVVIAAETVSSGVVIMASGKIAAAAGNSNDGLLILKTGPDGSESEVDRVNVGCAASTSSGVPMSWYESSLDWSAEQSISITGTNSIQGTGHKCIIGSMIVLGA